MKNEVLEVKSTSCLAMKGLLEGPGDVDEVFTDSEDEDDGGVDDENYDSGDGGDLVADSIDIVMSPRRMHEKLEVEAKEEKEEEEGIEAAVRHPPPPPPSTTPPRNTKVGVVKKRKPPPPPHRTPSPVVEDEASKSGDNSNDGYVVSDIDEEETPPRNVNPVTMDVQERKKWVVKGADLENVGLPARKTIVVPPSSLKPPPPATPPPLSAIKASEPRRRSLLERRNSNGGLGISTFGRRSTTASVSGGISITALVGMSNSNKDGGINKEGEM